MIFRRPLRHQPDPLIHYVDDRPPQGPPPGARPTPPPAPAAAPPPPPAPAKKRKEFPMGTLAFLTVFGTGFLLYRAGAITPGGVRIDDEVTKAWTVSEHPKVFVDTFNGPIEVTRGEPGKVDCLVVRHAHGPDREAAEKAVKAIAVTIDRDAAGAVHVSAKRIGRVSGAGATVRLRVPEGALLALRTDNGQVDVRGIEGPVEAHTTNGSIEVKEATGAVVLATTNGRIRCEAEEALVKADSTNGSVEYHGALAPGENEIRTTNGRVVLHLPEKQSLRLDAKVGHGKIESDFDVRNVDKRRHSMTGIIGDDPKADLQIRTSNGDVRLVEDDD